MGHALDRRQIEGGILCTRCRRTKPLDAFGWQKARGKPHSWCKRCKCLADGLRRETEAYRQAQQQSRSPESQKAKRAKARAWDRSVKGRSVRRAWANSEYGRVCRYRCNVRRCISRCNNPERLAELKIAEQTATEMMQEIKARRMIAGDPLPRPDQ